MYLPHKSALPLGVRLRLWFGRFLLKREYVFLIDTDGKPVLRRVFLANGCRYAKRYPFLDDGWVVLLDGGDTHGLLEIKSWTPYN